MRLSDAVRLGPQQPRRQCFTVEIVSDITFEGDEKFQVHITPTFERVELVNGTANVTIIDYNGESCPAWCLMCVSTCMCVQ